MKKCRTYRKIMTKSLSLLLCLLLFFYAVPTVIYAEIADAVKSEAVSESSFSSSEAKSTKTEETIDAYEGVAYEVEELREENVKHFRLEDGSYVAAQYNYPVHTMNSSGKYVDIDNTLTESSGGMLSSPNARVKFAKKITGNGTLFELHDGSTKITMYLIGAEKKTEGKVTNGTDDGEDTTLGKMMNLEKLTSSIIYENILDGTDLEYVVSSLNIKENIIVKERRNDYTYSFELALNGLTAELNESGDVIIYEGDAVKYTVPAPVVFDAKGVHAPTDAAEYILAGGHNGKYVLSVTASREWMNNEERVFPVTIDPTISTGVDWIEDTSISNAAPSTAFGSETTLPITPNRTAFWKTTVLPPVPASASIISATITMRISNSTYGDYVGVYRVLTDWDESLTYNQHISSTNPKGEIDTELVDYSYLTSGYATWDITSLVKGWYDGSIEKYGIAFKAVAGMTASTGLASSENAIRANRPSLLVTYLDFKGVEDYWSYSSQTVGAGGTGSINLATGQLTFAIPTLTTTDSLMPYTVSLVYNSSLANLPYIDDYTCAPLVNEHAGLGWKLSTYETVERSCYLDNQNNLVYYYIYADADGTEHGFYLSDAENEIYTDENGMQMILTEETDGSIKITDDSKQTKIFKELNLGNGTVTDGWILTRIYDNNQNAIDFTYDNNGRLTKVSTRPLGLISVTMLEFYYHDSGMLRMVYNSASREAVVFRYSNTYNGIISTTGKYLCQVDFAYGNESVTLSNWSAFCNSYSNTTNITKKYHVCYNYNSAGRLKDVVNYRLYQDIAYTWTDGKVTKVTEGNPEENGQSVVISYGTGYTDVNSSGNDDAINTSDDVITRYVFDNRGRAVSVYSTNTSGSEIYGATTGKYETQENVKNNIKEQTTLGGSSVNYLLNGDFEEWSPSGGFTGWQKLGTVARANSISGLGIGNNTVKFSPAAGASASILCRVGLKAGKYTLSFPYQTQNCDGMTGKVSIINSSNNQLIHTEEISLNENSSNGIRSDFSTTFEVASSTLITYVRIVISFTAGSNHTLAASLYVDNVSLENSVGATGFNLVNYGSFFANHITPNTNSVIPLSSYWTTESSAVPTVYSEDTAFLESAKITGSISNSKYVKQRIYEASSERLYNFDYQWSMFQTNTILELIVSGFAKAPEAAYSPKAKFRLRADVIYYQGVNKTDVTVSHYYDFLPGIDGWQFTSGSLDLDYIPEDQYDEDADYTCVRYIDIVCEYSYQPNGYALFDNISVVNSTGTDITKYSYYSSGTEDGLLAKKENYYYTEYYEYDEDRNISRVANNKGEIVDYEYNGYNEVVREISYDFSYMGGNNYPITLEDPDSVITKTPKTVTTYTYNQYGQLTLTETYPVDESLEQAELSKKISHSYTYNTSSGSRIFGALLEEESGLGTTTRYYYDNTSGRLLATLNVDDGTGLAYTYDDEGRIVGVTPATYVSNTSYTAVTGEENVSYEYNYEGRLETISTDSTTYNFTYDYFGNQASVKIGNQALAAYVYNDYNGKLKKIIYGNGYTEEYVYNDLELLSEVWYNVGEDEPTLAYEYEYTASGQVYKVTDNIQDRETVHRYDTSGRLVGVVQYDVGDMFHDFSTEITYNDKGELYVVNHKINCIDNTASPGVSGITYYNFYETDGRFYRVNVVSPETNGYETYTYDDYERVEKITHNYNVIGDTSTEFNNEISYTYKENGTNTSGLVETYTSTVNGVSTIYTYTYDDRGYITKIVDGSGNEIRYYYDGIGQLVREDNELIGATFVYTYDNAGNITGKGYCSLTPEGTDATPSGGAGYYYSTSSWGDLLVEFDQIPITYDAIGNPLNYYNGSEYTFTWQGRRMITAQVSGKTMSFTYNDEGIRTSKTVNGVTTTYYLNGSQIVGEETNGNLTIYLYDSMGMPIGMQYHDASYSAGQFDVFWFEKNMQGDIVAVYDESGNKLVSYVYDAWGKIINPGNSNLSEESPLYKNPFRYRGYYYDLDLGLYYVNSRYYDANVCRWLNADAMISGNGGSLHGYNLYAYCFNNPVNFDDHSGNWPKWLKKAVAAVAIVAVVAVAAAVTVATAGAGSVAAVVAVGAAKGAAIGLVSGAASGAAIGYATTGTLEGALDGMADGALTGAVTGAITGAAGSAVKVSQAAKAWDSGTFKSGYDSMKYHYNKHVVREGLTKGNNVIKYTQDAVDFANRNSSVLKYTYNYNYGNASWNLTYSTGQGGMFTSVGKILTFWYR